MDYGMTSLFKQMRKWIGIPMCMYLLEHWNIGKWYCGICEVLFNVLYILWLYYNFFQVQIMIAICLNNDS